MENQFLNLQTEKGLEVTPVMKSQLKETSKWAKFLAILGFIGLGIMVLVALLFMVAGSALPTLDGFSPTLFGIIYLVFAGIYFLPIKYLYDFSTQMSRAVTMTDQQSFSNAIDSLKSHYKFIGIMTIVMISLYLLMIIGVIVVTAIGAAGAAAL